MTSRAFFSAGICLLAALPGAAQEQPARPAGVSFAPPAFTFEPNSGQAPPDALFVGASGAVQFRRHALVLLPAESTRPAVELEFLRAARRPSLVPLARRPGIHNYYLGPKVIEQVPTYASLRYTGLYRGTDLLFYGQGENLEYDFELRPGANPRAIRFRFRGADRVKELENGDLLIEARGRSFRHHRPVSYQKIGGRKIPVDSRFAVDQRTGEIGFAVGAYDRSQTLTIDPVLAFLWRADTNGRLASSAVDAAGNTFLVSSTSGSVPDIQVQKITASGGEAYLTTFGGSLADQTGEWNNGGGAGYASTSICVDGNGNVYVTGATASTDFPVLNPIVWSSGTGSLAGDSRRGTQDAFLTKLSSTGGMLFSSYVGGTGTESGRSVAVDAAGNVIMIGRTTSTDLPNGPGPFPGNQIYVLNVSLPSGLPTVTSFELTSDIRNVLRTSGGTTYYLGPGNFVRKLGAGVVWVSETATPNQSGIEITTGFVDAGGDLYVAGYATADGLGRGCNVRPGAPSAFVARIFGGFSYAECRYIGGYGSSVALSVAVDSSSNIYVGGTYLNNVNDFFGPATGGGRDAFVVKYRQLFSPPEFKFFLGATSFWDDDVVPGMNFDSAGNLYFAGNVGPSPVVDAGSLLGAPSGTNLNRFVAKLGKADIRARLTSLILPQDSSPLTPGPGVALAKPNRRNAGVTPGQDVEFIGDFINQPFGAPGTSSAASKVKVTASTPASLEISPVGSACVFNGQSCGTQITGFQAPIVDTLGVNQTVGLDVKYRVKPEGSAGSPTPGSTVNFSFTGTADTDDPDPSNNTVSLSFKVNVPVTAATSPTGLPVTVSNYKGPVSAAAPLRQWLDPDAQYSLSVDPFVPAGAGARFRFNDWQVGAQSYTTTMVNVPAPVWPAITTQANFKKQYQVSAAASDPTRGSVALSASPTADTYYDESSNVTVTATALPGYQFSSFSGSVTTTANPVQVPVSGVLNVVANFVLLPPPAPVNPTPANNATGVSTTPALVWGASPTATAYDVYFGTAANPPLAASNVTALTYNPGALTTGTVYFWRVVAKNSGGANTSATWSFTTLGVAPPPGAPGAPAPATAAVNVSTGTALNWTAGAGATAYDIYFGTTITPQLVASDLPGTTYLPAFPGALAAATTYYWRVVAKNSGGNTSSPTWWFTTSTGGAGNDEPAGAVLIPRLPFQATQNTQSSTSNPSDPIHTCTGVRDSNTVWFRYVAGFTGPVRVSTAGSGYDTVLAAYPGTSAPGSQLACNDDFNGTLQSEITFDVTAGQSYLIEVSDFNDTPNGGALVFNVTTDCTYNLTFTTRRQPVAGGASAGNLATGATCSWTGVTDTPAWLSLTNNLGPGSKAIGYSALANSGRARVGTITTGTGSAAIMQDGNPAVTVFDDVPASSPNFDYISMLQSYGITAGCRASPPLYCPDIPVTRAQMSVFIVIALRRMMTIAPSTTTPYFNDMQPISGYFPFVQSIKDLGITAGCSVNPPLFCSDSSITHGQMAVFMILSWMQANNQTTLTYTQTPYFTDVPATHPFFRFIQKMRDLGFRSGCSPTQYCPDSQVTRGEMAPLILRAILGIP